jgi:hypothetical protein
MGSLMKVTKDEFAKRVPGRDGQAETSRPSKLMAGLTAAKGTATATTGVVGLVKNRRDQKRAEERRRRRRRARIATVAGVATAGGAIALKLKNTNGNPGEQTPVTPAETVGSGPAEPVATGGAGTYTAPA